MALTSYLKDRIPQSETYLKNGWSQDVAGVQFPLQSGVPIPSIYMFDIVPASFSANCISSANVWFPEGQPLNKRNTGSGDNVISIALDPSNPLLLDTPYFTSEGVLLDCERCISMTFNNPPAVSVENSVIFTGYDYLGKSITTSYEVPYGTNLTYFTINTPMLIVTSVVFSEDFSGGGGGVTVSIGNSFNIGLPYYLQNKGYFISGSWGSTRLSIDNIAAGTAWRTTNVDIESDAARGYVDPNVAPDGETLLTCCYYVYGVDPELSREIAVTNQSALKVVPVQISTGPEDQLVLPFMTPYDLTGVVYPGDNAFMYQYNQLKAS